MKKGICLIVSLILLFASVGAFAQESGDNLVTGNFHEVTFNEFVQKIEAQSSFHFYYVASQFDSISITISVTKAHLPSVLDNIFNTK